MCHWVRTATEAEVADAGAETIRFVADETVLRLDVAVDNRRRLAVREGDASADLFHQIRRLDGHEGGSVGVPEFLQTAARDVLRGEVAAYAALGFEDVCIEDADDVWLTDERDEDGYAEHIADVVEAHAGALEDLHRLPPEEAVFHPIDLRKRALAEEALHLVGVANDLSVF